MRSAVPSLVKQLPAVVRRSRWSQTLALVALTGACSVYSADLVGTTDSSVTPTGGSGSSVAGKTGGSTVVPSGGGGGGKLSTDLPGSGGDGGSEPDPEPVAGSGGVPGTVGGSAGSSNVGGGGSGNAGNGGTAGTPPVGAGDLLDGFEDQDLTIEQTGVRGGVWYLFDDATVGTAGPTPLVVSPLTGAPVELGGFAMHITATGFTGFGTGLGVDFRAGKKVYDGSQFSGIRFWAKVGAGKNTRHRIQIADGTTDPAGLKCNAAPTAPNGEKCEDHFGYNATFTSSWAQYIIPFSQLSQLGWGNPAAALDKKTLYGLQVTAKAKLEVDLWLDQIEFF